MKLYEILNYKTRLEYLKEELRVTLINWNFKNEKSETDKTLFQTIEEFNKVTETIERIGIELYSQYSDYVNAELVKGGIASQVDVLNTLCSRVRNLYNSRSCDYEFAFNTEELNKMKDDKERALLKIKNELNEFAQIDVTLSESLLISIGEYCG